MKNLKRFTFFAMLPLAAVFTSAVFIPATPDCPPDNPLEKNVIPVDVSAIKEIKLPTENTQRIILGDDDHGMLGSVKNIYLQDSFLYVDHPEKISIYDYSGAFHGNISSQGRAANEYLNLWYSWVDDDALYIYDLNGKKIIQYSFLLKKTNVIDLPEQTRPFQSLIPLGSKGYIGKQGFTGNVNEDPELGFYTPNYEFVQDIGSLKLNSGLQMGYPFSIFNNEVLYWRTLDREIYSIDEDLNFDVKYVVDFVGKNVPDFDFKDDYMKIQYINTVPEAYAVCLFDVEETDDYVSFVFLYGKTKNVAIYSKTTNSTSVCKFSWGHTESLNTIIPHKDKIIVVTDQENGNSIVYLMDIDDIIK